MAAAVLLFDSHIHGWQLYVALVDCTWSLAELQQTVAFRLDAGAANDVIYH